MRTFARGARFTHAVLVLVVLASTAIAQDTCTTTILMNAYTQAKGRILSAPVNGLRAKVGGKPAPVIAIRPSSKPLHLVIVIDASGSMTELKWHMTVDLARKIVRNPPNETDVGLLMFRNRKANSWPMTKDREVLFAELERYETSGGIGRTALWDSIARANTMFPQSSSRNVMVVISDGGDNISHLSESALQKELAKTGTRVFSFVLNDPDATDVERAEAAQFVKLAENRGGISLTLDAERAMYQKPPEQDQTLSAMAAVFNDFATSSYEVDLNTNTRTNVEKLVLRSDTKGIQIVYPRTIVPCSGRE